MENRADVVGVLADDVMDSTSAMFLISTTQSDVDSIRWVNGREHISVEGVNHLGRINYYRMAGSGSNTKSANLQLTMGIVDKGAQYGREEKLLGELCDVIELEDVQANYSKEAIAGLKIELLPIRMMMQMHGRLKIENEAILTNEPNKIGTTTECIELIEKAASQMYQIQQRLHGEANSNNQQAKYNNVRRCNNHERWVREGEAAVGCNDQCTWMIADMYYEFFQQLSHVCALHIRKADIECPPSLEPNTNELEQITRALKRTVIIVSKAILKNISKMDVICHTQQYGEWLLDIINRLRMVQIAALAAAKTKESEGNSANEYVIGKEAIENYQEGYGKGAIFYIIPMYNSMRGVVDWTGVNPRMLWVSRRKARPTFFSCGQTSMRPMQLQVERTRNLAAKLRLQEAIQIGKSTGIIPAWNGAIKINRQLVSKIVRSVQGKYVAAVGTEGVFVEKAGSWPTFGGCWLWCTRQNIQMTVAAGMPGNTGGVTMPIAPMFNVRGDDWKTIGKMWNKHSIACRDSQSMHAKVVELVVREKLVSKPEADTNPELMRVISSQIELAVLCSVWDKLRINGDFKCWTKIVGPAIEGPNKIGYQANLPMLVLTEDIRIAAVERGHGLEPIQYMAMQSAAGKYCEYIMEQTGDGQPNIAHFEGEELAEEPANTVWIQQTAGEIIAIGASKESGAAVNIFESIAEDTNEAPLLL